ncbi:MAG: hypothetical protein GF331_26530 [Chitinivibrionales bacterium]|nr:hypothetical protein [Chitinivibrionales bacterium]
MIRYHAFSVVIALLLAVPPTARAATVTLDERTAYQTIDGFGGFNADDDVAAVVDDLGLTIHRGELNPDGTPSPGWSTLRQLKNAGVRKFIFSIWSPPANMKTNNKVSGGGNLKPSSYAAFGNWCATFLKRFKQEVGIDCYALSLQNEPEFVEPYASCVYTAETYRDMLKVVGPILDTECPRVKLFGTETMLHTMGYFQAATLTDADGGQHLDIIAIHGYVDGVAPGSAGSNTWSKAANMAAAFERPLWMTETSGFADNWDGAMDLVRNLYASLYWGDLNGSVWWRLTQTASWQADTRWLIAANGRKTQRYYALKHYYRYVRPGAVRIDAVSDDAEVLVTAFHHPDDRTLSVVAINNASSSKTLSLTGDNLPSSYKRYLSTSSKNCSDEGSASNSGIALPGNSITTLVATGYDGRSVVSTSPRARPGARTLSCPTGRARLYSLDGRRIPATVVGRSGASAANGVYVSIDRLGHGRLTAFGTR